MSAMESKVSSYQIYYHLSIEGLNKIYVNHESITPEVYFEFDKKENLDAATKKIVEVWDSIVNPAQTDSKQSEKLELSIRDKKPNGSSHVAGYALQQSKISDNLSVDALIKNIAKCLQSEKDSVEVSFVHIKESDLHYSNQT
jgi:hypothetical protein